MPGLYDPQVATLVRDSLEHVWSVEFRDKAGALIPLDVVECEITMDDTWSPYVQGRVTAVIPTDQATLDRLDPRRFVKATVSAGYVLPNGVRDLQPLAMLYLSERTVSRPDDTVTLSIQGQEYLLGRAMRTSGLGQSIADAIGITSSTPVRDAIAWCLYQAGNTLFGYTLAGAGWDYANASQAVGWSGNKVSSTQDERYGADTRIGSVYLLDVARDIANLNGCWLRCDETGVWRCPRPAPPTLSASGVNEPQWTPAADAPASAALSVGEQGTVIESATGFDRDEEWANLVALHFSWKGDASGAGRWGLASITGGPFAHTAVGVVGLRLDEDLPYYVTQAVADDRARIALAKAGRMGRSITLGAIGMYWLRPQQQVTVQLPLGPQERHDISAVTYTLHEGRMSLRTALPDTASTITIGGA